MNKYPCSPKSNWLLSTNNRMKIQITVIAAAILAMLLLGLSDTIITKNTFALRASYDGQAPEDIIVDYCIAHADRAAAGENVVQDLVKTGLVSSYTFGDKTCEEVQGLQSTAHFNRCSPFFAIVREQPLDPDC